MAKCHLRRIISMDLLLLTLICSVKEMHTWDSTKLETMSDILKDRKYLVSVRYDGRDSYGFGYGHICGGVLIKSNLVLTAAHCFIDHFKYDGSFLPVSSFKVVVGNRYRYRWSYETVVQKILKRFTRRNKLDLTTYSEDIALLLLAGFVDYPQSIMSSISLNRSFLQPEMQCELFGWDYKHIPNQPCMVKHVNVTLIDSVHCQRGYNLSQPMRPDRGCASYDVNDGQSECTSDTGGALFCDGMLSGIISWGLRCQALQLPLVYTDVAHHSQWIDKVINHRSIRLRLMQRKRPGSTSSTLNGAINSIYCIFLFKAIVYIILYSLLTVV